MGNISRARKRRQSESGFALVISLSLMAFILVLVLSLSSLTQVELRSSSTQLNTLEARQNALLGLQIALGELQASAGRDRSTTGTVESDGALTIDPSKRYWTGVWANPGTYDVERNLMEYGDDEGRPDLSQILVSGDSASVEVGLSEEASSSWPVLVGAPTVDDPDMTVRAPDVPIENTRGGSAGRYAFWVGDEGVKARVNLSDPSELNESDDSYQSASSLVRLHTPPRSGTEQMRLNDVPLGEDFPSEPDLLSRIIDTNSLAFLFPQGDAFARDRFHDLTLHSEGLFTDQRLGGLRRDLTWMLRNDQLPTGFLYGEPVSVSAGRHSRDNPPGPAWNLFQKFYDTADPGPIPLVQDFRKRATADPSDHPVSLSPLVTQLKLYFNFAFGPAVGNHGGKLRMYLFPVVVLNNPYNRPLVEDDYRMKFIQHNTDRSTELEVQTFDEFGDPLRRFSGDGYRFKDFRNALFDPKGGSGSDNSGSIYFYAEDLAFEPGETKVLTLRDSGPYLGPLNRNHIQGAAHGSSNPDGNALAPGFNDANSAYVEFDDALEQDEEPEFYQFELINPGNIRFALGRKDVDGRFLLLTVNYDSFQDPDTLPIGARLTRSDTTFPRAGFTYTMDLGNVPHLADFNPRSTNMSIIDNVYESSGADRPPRLYKGDFGIGEFSTDVADADAGIGFFGPSHTSSGFVRTVLFEIPQSPDEFVSLGQFKHLDLSVRNTGGFLLDDTTHHAPAYILGNSRADPRVGTEASFLDTSETHRYGAAFDFSYRTNEALWDGFFFSTASNANGEPPLNRRIVSGRQAYEPPESPFDAAEALSLAGAFNVNSVSVNAWRAIISGLQDHELETIRSGTQDDVDFLFGTHARPLEGAFNYNGQGALSSEVWNQARSLKPEEIDALAAAIVAEVKERGPFLSLAHFINRSLGAPSKLTEKGALQAAIELAEPGSASADLNNGLGGNAVNPSDLEMDVPSPELFADHAFDGAPGRLTQADLLSALGPILSARSDTFRIRAYGESEALDNSSKVWCEAIVRRISQKVNPSEAIEEPSPVNSFGRQFEVVSFQWLPAQEENPVL